MMASLSSDVVSAVIIVVVVFVVAFVSVFLLAAVFLVGRQQQLWWCRSVMLVVG